MSELSTERCGDSRSSPLRCRWGALTAMIAGQLGILGSHKCEAEGKYRGTRSRRKPKRVGTVNDPDIDFYSPIRSLSIGIVSLQVSRCWWAALFLSNLTHSPPHHLPSYSHPSPLTDSVL